MLTTEKTNSFQLPLLSGAAILSLTCSNPTAVLAQYSNQIQQLEQQRSEYQLEADNLKTEMGFYMLRNPKASAAVLASGVGIAAVLEQNLDPAAKATIALAGMLGARYCLEPDNRQHCAEVTANLMNYGAQLSNYDEQIDSLTGQINSLQGNSWTRGIPHPKYPNVIAGDTGWQPATGYKWRNPDDDNDFSVIPIAPF